MPTTDTPTQRQKLWLCALILAALVIGAFWKVIHAEFQIYDDWDYVVTNDVVRQGLNMDGISWAFQKFHASNWHPLTWISHMLDVQLYGLRPMGHHVTNLILHVINTLLLLALFNKMTGSIWRSAVVAALFGLHPTHVESVAWVAERKDVLSTFFGLLSLIAYAAYATRSSFWSAVTCHRFPTGRHVSQSQSADMSAHSKPSHLDCGGTTPLSDSGDMSPGLHNARSPQSTIHYPPSTFLSSPRYWLALLLFALGLMSKPMLVTWPFVMLLLDVWPLNRLNLSTIRPLIVEKIPFFLLTAASCVLTFLAQRAGGAVQTIEQLSLPVRVGNTAVSYVRYLGKTFWPADLSIFYPYPEAWPVAVIVGSCAAIVVLIALAVWQIRARPFLAVGLFWFLGTLVPVIGLVQVGSQSMADRYQYIPQIGLFAALIWGLTHLIAPKLMLQRVASAAAVLCVIACFVLTRARVEDWRDSERLFTQALRVTKNNFIAHNNLGLHRLNQKKYDLAIESFKAALAERPGYAATHNNLALAYMSLGRVEEALASFQDALKYSPGLYQARVNLASIYTAKNRLNDALELLENHFPEIEEYPEGLCALANLMMEMGRLDEATRHAESALRIRPDYADAYNCIGSIALKRGLPDEAIKNYRVALSINPNSAEVRRNIALAHASVGNYPDSIAEYQAALELRPDYLPAHLGLAIVLQETGQLEEGSKHWSAALKLAPDLWAAHEQMALLLSKQGKYHESISHFSVALKHQTNSIPLVAGYALALDQLGQFNQATSAYRDAIKLYPDQPEVLNNLSWILAAANDDSIRDGAEAVRHAEAACRLTEFKEARFIGTLAAAYAEAGRFDDAVKTAQRAIEQAKASKQPDIAARNTELLELYRARKPYHETATP